MKLYKPALRVELSLMETKQELQAMLKRLEAMWDSGNIGDPHEIAKLDRQMKELKKKIQAMEG